MSKSLSEITDTNFDYEAFIKAKECIPANKGFDGYDSFLDAKVKRFEASGFVVSDNDLNDKLFDFQKHCVSLALRKGRFGLFEECGLGKTFQQLEWAHRCKARRNRRLSSFLLNHEVTRERQRSK